MAEHKQSVININNSGYNSKKAVYIRQNGGWDDWEYKIIEVCDKKFITKCGAKWRERYLIESGKCSLNSSIPILTDDERKIKQREQAQKVVQRYMDDPIFRNIIKKRNNDRYHNNEEVRNRIKTKQKEKYWSNKLAENWSSPDEDIPDI